MARKLQGTVVSDKMDKTVVVEVRRIKRHPKYGKRYRVDKKYKAHDEKSECVVGDQVVIRETKPISRDKNWVVIERTKKASQDVEDKDADMENKEE